MIQIIVVDDEPDIREILQYNLELAGYSVVCAQSAEEALARITPECALILLDIMMSGMSGYEMAERLRSEQGNEVPIIFLTAKGEERDMLRGFSAGGDDYIVKPFLRTRGAGPR
jgi:DNA-binding response OmpR family regulator